MTELVGDSSRGADFALVRLRVDGDRIIDADADGLSESLLGLTLLEAAAVGGETLAVDALANAIGPTFRAPLAPGRTAVAMSGGVDSAVALLKSLPNAVGVTLRLWLDPQGPDAERACCSPEAVLAARATCHGFGIPHVTLDLRETFRRAVVAPFVRGYECGETPNPCITCNGAFRFAHLLAFARRTGAEKLATGHYARIVDYRGRRLLARAADTQKDQSYMLARLDPAKLHRISFPLGVHTKAETRAEAARAGLAVAGRGESQEACFLAGDERRRGGVGPAFRVLALHARSAQRAGRLRGGAPVRVALRSEDEHRRRRATGSPGADDADGAWCALRPGRSCRGEAAVSLRCRSRIGGADIRRFPARARPPGLRDCTRPGGCSVRRRRSRRSRCHRLRSVGSEPVSSRAEPTTQVFRSNSWVGLEEKQ
ncbi:MAG: hypothetical protein E6G33_15950 [Actinobacteria bacterium]|nr:MAG: hypothetical protein E6G33_15950 [Actinomycetota bacterium]